MRPLRAHHPSMALLLLCALMGSCGAVAAAAGAGCALTNHTLWLERPECGQCVAVNTTICSGYCYTQDTNLKGRLGRSFLLQRACVPRSLAYRSVCLPGCPPAVDPRLSYPAALRCGCRRCHTATSRCLRSSPFAPDQCGGGGAPTEPSHQSEPPPLSLNNKNQP